MKVRSSIRKYVVECVAWWYDNGHIILKENNDIITFMVIIKLEIANQIQKNVVLTCVIFKIKLFSKKKRNLTS
jgi:hypothetical protein